VSSVGEEYRLLQERAERARKLEERKRKEAEQKTGVRRGIARIPVGRLSSSASPAQGPKRIGAADLQSQAQILRKVRRQSTRVLSARLGRNSSQEMSPGREGEDLAAATSRSPPGVSGSSASPQQAGRGSGYPTAPGTRSSTLRPSTSRGGATSAGVGAGGLEDQQTSPSLTARSSVAGLAITFALAQAAVDARKTHRAPGAGLEDMALSAGLTAPGPGTSPPSPLSHAAPMSPDDAHSRASLSSPRPTSRAGDRAAADNASPTMHPSLRHSGSIFDARMESITGIDAAAVASSGLSLRGGDATSRSMISPSIDDCGGSDVEILQEYERTVLHSPRAAQSVAQMSAPGNAYFSATSASAVSPSQRPVFSATPGAISSAAGGLPAVRLQHSASLHAPAAVSATIPEETANETDSDDGSGDGRNATLPQATRPNVFAGPSQLAERALVPLPHASAPPSLPTAASDSVMRSEAERQRHSLLTKLTALSELSHRHPASGQESSSTHLPQAPPTRHLSSSNSIGGSATSLPEQQHRAGTTSVVRDGAAGAVAASRAAVLADSSKAADSYNTSGEKGLHSLLASLSTRASNKTR
jgi:hypothetical protein